MKVGKRFTIFDMMENKGVFEQNTANTTSPGYVKADYPKMLYHPEGKTRITFAGTSEINPYTGAARMVGQQIEIINRTVNNLAEEKEWLAKGWLTHPARAMAAAGLEAPATSSAERIAELEAQLKAGAAELALAKQSKLTQVAVDD